MAQEIASLYAKIGADTAGFKSGMAGVNSSIHSTGGLFRNFTNGIVQGIGQAFGNAAIRTMREFGDAMAGTLKNAAGLEQGVADISAVLGATGEESAKLSKLITDLGIDPKLKVTAFEAAGAIEMLAKNGLDLQEIMGGAARSTVLLSNSTGGDFATSADIATSAMAQFGIKAEDMAKAVDQIVGVTRNSKFDVNDYRLAIAQAGGVAASVGVEFEDFNAILAASSSVFASGSDAGTSFKTFLQRLVPQSGEAADAMRNIGLYTGLTGDEFEKVQAKIAKVQTKIDDLDPSAKNYRDRLWELSGEMAELKVQLNAGESAFFDAGGQMKSMAEISEALNKAFSGLSEEQKISAASTIFGTDAMRMAFAVANNGADSINKFKKAIGDTSAEESAAIRMDTLSGDWEIFQGIVETLSIQIGQKFLPHARSLVQWATEMATTHGPRIVDFFGRIADMLPGLGTTALNFFNMISGPGVIKTITLLRDAFFALGRTLAVLVRPFKEAFSGLFTELQTMRSAGFSDIFGVVMRRLGQAIKGFADVIRKDIAPAVWEGLMALWNKVVDWANNITWEDIVGWAKAIWGWAVDLWTEIYPHLQVFWKELSSWVTDPDKRQQLWDAVVSGWNIFTEWASKLWEWMKPELTKAWEWLISWVKDPEKRQQIWDAIVSGWNVFSDWASKLIAWMTPYLLAAWDWLTSWITDPDKRKQLWDGIVYTWNVFQSWAQAVRDWMAPYLIEAFKWLASWITDPAKRAQLWEGIKNNWDVFTGFALALIPWIGPGLSLAWFFFKDWLIDPSKRAILWEGIKATWNVFTEFAESIWENWLKPPLDGMWQAFTYWTSDPQKRQEIYDSANPWGKKLIEWGDYLWKGGEGFEGMEAKLDRWWSDFSTWMTSNFPKVSESLTRLSKSFAELFETLDLLFSYENEKGTRVTWRTFWDDLDTEGLEGIDKVVADVVDFVDRVTRLLIGFAKILAGFRENDWRMVWEGMTEISGAAMEQISLDAKDMAKFVPETLDMKLNREMNGVQTTWSDIWSGMSSKPGKAKSEMVAPFAQPIDWGALLNTGLQTAVAGWNALWAVLGATPRNTKNQIMTDLDAHSPSKEFQKIANSILDAFANFDPTWKETWSKLRGPVNESADILGQAVSQLGDYLNRKMNELSDKLVATWRNMWDWFFRHQDEVTEAMRVLGRGLGMGMLDSMKAEILPTLPGIANDAIRRLVDGFNSSAGAVNDSVRRLGMSFGEGLIAGIMAGISNNPDAVALQTMLGLVNGINSRMKWVTDVGNDLARAVLDPIRNALGIHSESTVFKEIGRWIDVGLGHGIEENISLPTMAIEKMVRHTVEAVPSGDVGISGNSNRLDVYLHAGEGTLPSNRAQLQELMRMLQRELTLAGARASY